MASVSIGELVKWRHPQEPMFSFGIVIGYRDKFIVIECKDYYAGMIVEVPKRYIRKIERGGRAFGRSKKYSK